MDAHTCELDEDRSRKLRNYHECPVCYYRWSVVRSCTCDAECPTCGHANIPLYNSEEVKKPQ